MNDTVNTSEPGEQDLLCARCHTPIKDDLIQVPLGIAIPEFSHNTLSGEPLNYHRQCCDWEEVNDG